MTEKERPKEDSQLTAKEKSIISKIQDAEKMEMLLKVFNIAKNSVCKVKPANKEQGIGAFLIEERVTTRFLFMTCNKVLPTISFNEISNVILEFSDIPQMTSYAWEKDINHIKYIWTSKLYDATIIEISSDLAGRFSSYGVQYLKVSQITSKVEVASLQCQKDKFGIAHGVITCTNGHEVFCQIAFTSGNIGSPLLNFDCSALALYTEGVIDENKEEHEDLEKACNMIAIIDAYIKDQENDIIQYVKIISNDLLFRMTLIFKTHLKI